LDTVNVLQNYENSSFCGIQTSKVEACVSFTFFGTCGDNCAWGLDADTEVLTIFGSGEMTSYPWTRDNYKYLIKSVDIKNGITSIVDYAFSGVSSLTSLTVPDSLTSIGEGPFYDCDELQYNEDNNALYLGNEGNLYLALIRLKDKSITSCKINENTKVISDKVFSYCNSLTSINIPDAVTSIGRYAFYNCEQLKSVNIPGSVTSIGGYAFKECYALSHVCYFGNTDPGNGNDVFPYCYNLRSVSVTENYTDSSFGRKSVSNDGTCSETSSSSSSSMSGSSSESSSSSSSSIIGSSSSSSVSLHDSSSSVTDSSSNSSSSASSSMSESSSKSSGSTGSNSVKQQSSEQNTVLAGAELSAKPSNWLVKAIACLLPAVMLLFLY